MPGKKKRKTEPKKEKTVIRGRKVFKQVIWGFILKLLSLVLVVGIILWAAGTFFRVREIIIEGNGRYTDAELLTASGLQEGDSMLLMRKNHLRNKLLQENLYLSSVSIRRTYPGTVTVSVTEYSEDYAIAINGAYWICDRSGVLLALRTYSGEAVIVQGVTMSRASEGTVFTCADFAKDTLLKTIFSAIEETGLWGQVTLIDVSESYRPVITVEDRLDFVLGNASDAAAAVAKIPSLMETAREEDFTTGTFEIAETQVRRLTDRVTLTEN